MDETYVKVNGEDRYLYRAVDKEGQTVEFLFTSRRDRNASLRFLEKATKNAEDPSLINIDQSRANTAGTKDYNKKHETEIEICQSSLAGKITLLFGPNFSCAICAGVFGSRLCHLSSITYFM